MSSILKFYHLMKEILTTNPRPQVRKAQEKNGQVISEMVALLTPFFGPVLIANHGKYNKTYNTKWRISYATHLFAEDPAFADHSNMIFIDYGGGGPSPSVYTRSVSASGEVWVKETSPDNLKQAQQALVAKAAPKQEELRLRLLSEIHDGQVGAVADNLINGLLEMRAELGVQAGGTGAVLNPVPIYIAQTGPLRSVYYE